ncbi:MAG: phosphoribosylformylglycinamidine cyclo-ligase [Coriobacteriia bacterium]|nr:phosphoribosylformylglycinamidine cyclo-ligase [Coriobacteriia bacterium]
MESKSEAYAKAGVDITAGYRAVELMKKHIARTTTETVGGFGGCYELDLEGITKPVLVSGTDGVGTKLKLAHFQNKHDTIGIDCVAMCVNDVICVGAKPLYFLDYIACGKNVPERIEQIVAGVAEGCVQSGCALIGGETAEMPGFYAEDEYDLAGYTTGVVDKNKMIYNHDMQEGDVIIGIPSSGVHSNGFSLVRSVFSEDELKGEIGAELLTPTRIYVKDILALKEKAKIKGISHITGGGFYENIPRSIPDGLGAKIFKDDIQVLPIFNRIQEAGNISEHDMFNTFNMGVGMSVVLGPNDVNVALEIIKDAYIIGEIAKQEDKIILC